MFANDRVDQFRRRDIECRIINFDSAGGRLPAEAVGDFFARPALRLEFFRRR